MFQKSFWNLFKILQTALMYSSQNGYIEIVKLLIGQEDIDVNIQDVFLLYSMYFIPLLLDFNIKFGIYWVYLNLHSFMRLKIVMLKLLNCFLNIMG